MIGGRGANASTVTAASARKLQAAFACNGSDYGGGGVGGGGCGGGGGGGEGDCRRGGGSRARFVLGGDHVANRGTLSQCMVLPPRADIPSTRIWRFQWEG